MPNFARSNAYSVFPFTTCTFVSRPSANIWDKLPVHAGGREVVFALLLFIVVFR